jgi:hypothetical protein
LKSKNYFTQETEDAIILYNQTTDNKEKNRIYEKLIHYPFFKLTENIIHTFKFYYMEVDEIEHLQHEVIIFLLSKMHGFNPSVGAKAYSYFGTIALRYLINYNNKNYKRKVEKLPYESLIDNNKYSYDLDLLSNKISISQFLDEYIKYVTNNIFDLFCDDEEAKIADAILELFRKRNNIELFNKKAIYIYIREIIDVKTPKITKVAKKLYKIYKRHFDFYLEYDYLNFQN